MFNEYNIYLYKSYNYIFGAKYKYYEKLYYNNI
jgi:hypothetical protein